MAFVATPGMQAAKRGFAIFVDSTSNSRVAPELQAYSQSVDRNGLQSQIVVINQDVTPDSIRSIIRSLASRKSAPIEGMVFVGDIPIPMLLDAQHLSSAFKIQQNPKRLERSACPSDRFYDDLNLKFDFVSRDPKKPTLYYYSLRSDSPQRTAPQLYSGRIKSMNFYGKDKYENLRDYLRKVVEVKKRVERMDRMFYFSGSGYNSESMLARVDEKAAHFEQFPWLKNQKNALSYMDHSQEIFAKYPIMQKMQDKDLKLALLHHHGAVNKEYMNRYPDTRSVGEQLEGARSYFRSKIRSGVEDGKPLDSVIAYYSKKFDVPTSWFDNVMDPASIAADSIYNEKLDLHLYEFGDYKPNARVVILDACFNGAFSNDEYIAAGYIFGEGDCVVAIANSVNSLQDKWPDKNIGLLGHGMRVGNFVKYNPYLESHIFGDPTFAFYPSKTLNFDMNDALKADSKFWGKQLKSQYAPIQSMAVEQLYNAGKLNNANLLSVFKSNENFLTRLSAFMLLSKTGSPEFEEAIALGLNDSYELIRRFSASFAGKNGNPSLIPAIVASYVDPTKGERVAFQLQMAMTLFDTEAMLAELERQAPFAGLANEKELMEKTRKGIRDSHSVDKYEDSLALLKKDNPSPRDLKIFLRQLRNNPLHPGVEELFDFLYKTKDEECQLILVEAFGWFDKSYRRGEVATRLEKVAADSRFSDKVRNEAEKSLNRVRY